MFQQGRLIRLVAQHRRQRQAVHVLPVLTIDFPAVELFTVFPLRLCHDKSPVGTGANIRHHKNQLRLQFRFELRAKCVENDFALGRALGWTGYIFLRDYDIRNSSPENPPLPSVSKALFIHSSEPDFALQLPLAFALSLVRFCVLAQETGKSSSGPLPEFNTAITSVMKTPAVINSKGKTTESFCKRPDPLGSNDPIVN